MFGESPLCLQESEGCLRFAVGPARWCEMKDFWEFAGSDTDSSVHRAETVSRWA